MTVDLFIPCFIDHIYPDTAFNTIKLLKKAGVNVEYNKKQTCCGQPAFNSGQRRQALKLAKKFLKDFTGQNPVVAPSASCTGYVRKRFPVLSENKDFLKKHDKLRQNIFELTDFLVNQIDFTDFGAYFPHKVTYHDACSALREYGIKKEPRLLLSKVKGLQLVEMQDSDVCCGFGGTFYYKYEPISVAMVQQKVENALATGAEYIVSTEASCLMNIEGYIKRNKLNIKTIHIADILASGW